MMRNRARTLNREINEIVNQVRAGKNLTTLQASYFYMISKMQIMIDMPTYIGAYEKGGGPDTIPPSVPANLSAIPVSSSQINVAWSASTDNVAVTGYRVFRGGSWRNEAQRVRSASRYSNLPVITYNNVGFRVVRPVL